MIAPLLRTPLSLIALAACVTAAWQVRASGDLVAFPETYAQGVRYATVHRGDIREDLYASRDAIEAAKAGRPFPSGTVLTLVDTRDGQLFRYVVMEKRTGWGSSYPPGQRTGEWEFQWFNPDRTVRAGEDLARCRSCHQSRAAQDFVWSVEQMRAVP